MTSSANCNQIVEMVRPTKILILPRNVSEKSIGKDVVNVKIGFKAGIAKFTRHTISLKSLSALSLPVGTVKSIGQSECVTKGNLVCEGKSFWAIPEFIERFFHLFSDFGWARNSAVKLKKSLDEFWN